MSSIWFIDQSTGLRCCIAPGTYPEYLCGYVRIPYSKLRKRLMARSKVTCKGSFRHIRLYRADTPEILRLDVHGGVNFFGKIYKYPYNRPVRGLWIGFECGDIEDYKNPKSLKYVKGEVVKLAAQIHQLLNKEKHK